MSRLPHWLRVVLVHLRKFYTGTLIFWLVWVIFIDNNNAFVVFENYQKMKELERDLSFYQEQVRLVKEERDEVLGTDEMLEKWAREKYLMRKPTEDVYVIVDENGESIEKKE